jgi:hypothetical protein
MEGKIKQRKFRLSPSMVVSVVALFTALTGAAAALPGTDSVNSRDIIDQAVKAKDLNTESVQADELGDGITAHNESVVVDGGVNENGAYSVGEVIASCGPGEELISGSGAWGNAANEELFLQEIILDHNNEEVTVRGGNDTNADRTLFAAAHCLQA